MSFSYSAMKNYIFITDLKTVKRADFFFLSQFSSGCSAELVENCSPES